MDGGTRCAPISSFCSADEANNHEAKYRLELYRILNSAESPQELPGAMPMASTKKKRTPKKKNRWSQRVTTTSDALDLDKGVFSLESPRAIARSLKRSAEQSRRRKSEPFRSAMSMLNFYLNRAGRNLSNTRRARLNAAKGELRALYHRRPGT
jgi:hypothetical protein